MIGDTQNRIVIHITTILIAGFIFTDLLNVTHVSVEGFVVSPICPMNMVSGGFMPFTYTQKQKITKADSHENHHGVIKAAMFALWAMPEVEADFYKTIKTIEEAAAMTGFGETVYAIRMSLKKYICKSASQTPTSQCDEEKEKGYNCCVLVADRSPDIFPRRLLEYECVDFSALATPHHDTDRSLKRKDTKHQRLTYLKERVRNFTRKFHNKHSKIMFSLPHM